MKTVKDLRDFVTEEGGSIKIGFLELVLQEDKDINIDVGDNLLTWISNEEEDDTLLEKLELSIMDRFKGENSASRKKRRENDERTLELEKEFPLILATLFFFHLLYELLFYMRT